jgi:hypothetical protein
MEASASSGRMKRLFHRKSMASIDVIEHVLNVANSYMAYSDAVAVLHLKTVPSSLFMNHYTSLRDISLFIYETWL